MRRALEVLAVVAMSLAVAPARACTCDDASPAARIAASDIVFRGRVISVDAAKRERIARIRVLRRIKGEPGDVVEVRTRTGIGACGYSFRAGESLTVAANAREGYYSTSRCLLRGPDRSD